MAIQLRVTPDGFDIFKNTASVVRQNILASLILMGIAAGLLLLRPDVKSSTIAAAVCGFFAITILVVLAKRYQQMKRDRGAIILRANSHHLTLGKVHGQAPKPYDWDKIRRIVLVRRLSTHDEEGRSTQHCQAIVYFRFEQAGVKVTVKHRARSSIWQSPEGHNITMAAMPKEIDAVSQLLQSIAPETLTIDYYNSATFDYLRDSETFYS